MNPPTLSVLIPTYNRRDRLERCLTALQAQSLDSSEFEVLVMNDGSTDGTEVFLKDLQEKWPSLGFHTKKNEGQGLARNLGVSFAKGSILVFIDDDIYVTPDFLKHHLEFHSKFPQETHAALGLTEWWDGQKITPLMEWMTSKRGVQFAYPLLSEGQEASFWFFYTSNLSIKKSLLLKENFDADFRGYGWEDTELGYRLQKKHHMKLIYAPECLAHHDNPMDEEFLKKRCLKVAQSAKIFESKHPELQVIPRGFKRLAFELISCAPILWILKALACLAPKHLKPWFWYVLSKRYFLRGLKSV